MAWLPGNLTRPEYPTTAAVISARPTFSADRRPQPTLIGSYGLALIGAGGVGAGRIRGAGCARPALAIPFARALVRNASLHILDGPTASFDARTEHDLFVRFKELSRGRTTLLISRFTTIGMADPIAVLDGGSIVESGPARRSARASRRLRLALRAVRRLIPRAVPGTATCE